MLVTTGKLHFIIESVEMKPEKCFWKQIKKSFKNAVIEIDGKKVYCKTDKKCLQCKGHDTKCPQYTVLSKGGAL